jgi:AhpC/TSA family
MSKSVVVSRRRAVAVAGAFVLPLVAPRLMARSVPDRNSVAPDFAVEDANGHRVSLAAFLGRPVVLEWTNPNCPYVNKHYSGPGNMQALQRDAMAGGVVWLTILSATPGKMGFQNGLEASLWLEEQKAKPTHYLLDTTAAVAEQYGVSVALHMFVIDGAGKLAYSGAIDDKPTANAADIPGARNYVREALVRIAAGQVMEPFATRPYGCSAR